MNLEIKNLSVVYQDGSHALQALEEVSLELVPGRCLALVGESGSGKTTLGRACMGLLPPNARVEGQVSLNGRPIEYQDEAAINEIRWKTMAMVFQNGGANLNPVHRIVDQVAEPLIQRQGLGRAEAEIKAKAALSGMGLADELHARYPHQLSGGQVQRALLAMALILDPDVVILDEPTAALDAMSKLFVAGVIGQMKSRGQTVLLITHDLELAAGLADETAVLYLGQIMETLPAGDLLTNPLHPYTLALGRSCPTMTTGRDLGGIRGDAFYRLVHQHGRGDETAHRHSHIQAPGSVHQNGHAPPAGCIFQNRCTQAIEQCRDAAVALEQVGGHQLRCLRHGIASILELKGGSKIYGDIVALKPTDLTIRCGEVFCLVGETGSGKTTLAMIAAGVLDPGGGRRIFDGQDMDELSRRDFRALLRRIGVIYQNPAESISHRFSVLDAVAEPLRIHHPAENKSEIRDRVAKVLSDVHLSTDPAFLSRYPHELNMGAVQRVCLARALILDPALLIADEPTSSLDPSVQAKVLKMLLDLQIERGLSMLFVTHNIGLARKIGDRIGVMLAGRMVEAGPADLILSAPKHPYTRLLIDSVSGLAGDFVEPGGAGAPLGGCPFVPRCPRAQAVCAIREPEVEDLESGRVACHYPLTESRDQKIF